MKIFFFILVTSWLAGSGCNDRPGSNAITIEGRIKNLPDGWIWLTPSDRWKIHLDSALCKDGEFIMGYAREKFLEPSSVSLRYRDKTKPGGIATLNFRNHMLGADSMQDAVDAFYLEDHPVKIEGDLAASIAPRIFAGKETELMFKSQPDDFGWADFRDPAKRKGRIELFKTIIKQNPYSYFLLESLFRFKEQYAKEEFVDLLGLFQKDVRQSRLGDRILAYLSKRPSVNQAYSKMDLINPEGKTEKFPDSLQSVNMLVFWASWCLPCREEIDVLKELHKKFNNAGLQLIGVSIDENTKQWNQALAEEKMPWKQLRVGNDQIETVLQQYNFSDIPFTVFIDENGSEIKRFSGYDPESRQVYIKFLEDILITSSLSYQPVYFHPSFSSSRPVP